MSQHFLNDWYLRLSNFNRRKSSNGFSWKKDRWIIDFNAPDYEKFIVAVLHCAILTFKWCLWSFSVVDKNVCILKRQITPYPFSNFFFCLRLDFSFSSWFIKKFPYYATSALQHISWIPGLDPRDRGLDPQAESLPTMCLTNQHGGKKDYFFFPVKFLFPQKAIFKFVVQSSIVGVKIKQVIKQVK